MISVQERVSTLVVLEMADNTLVYLALCLSVVLAQQPGLSTPPDLYLGLYNQEETFKLFHVFSRDNYQHSCTEFTSASNNEGQTEECKYYGDCCKDPMRIREKLETGTFSCQPVPYLGSATIYVVDKCPSGTASEKLSALCERHDASPVPSTVDWPVTSTYTGVTYNNIYCAICHGVLDISNINEQLNNETAVQFWWTSIKCNSSEIIKELVISRDVLGRSEWLEELNSIMNSRKCDHTFHPSLGVQPHRCLPAIRTCPANYTDEEIIEMCKEAPADYRDGTDGRLYRNRFCQMCHGVLSLPETLIGGHVYVVREESNHNQSSEGIYTEVSNGDLLVSLKPQVQQKNKTDLSLSDRKTNLTQPQTVSFVSWANSLSQSYIYSLPTNFSTPNTFWDLGSIQCDSGYDGICDAFMKLPDDGCSGPGCGEEMWQNLDGQCSALAEYTYNPEVRENRTFIWPESLYGRYYSTCNPDVELKYERNCRCDTRCRYFKECCFDIELPDDASAVVEGLNYTCLPIQSNEMLYGYALVSSCPSSTDTELVELCKAGEAGTWSPLGWPVYDRGTTLSYKNSYCAECNNVELADMKFWTAILDCTYSEKTVLVGEYEAITANDWDDCQFREYKHPKTENDVLPYWCFINPIVSWCPSDYDNWKISRDCQHSISSWVYHNRTVYRNAFCAICNLGDKIISSNLYGLSNFGTISEEFENYVTNSVNLPKHTKIAYVEVDANNLECCFLETCGNSSLSTWGDIEYHQECLKLPFNITCYDHDSMMQSFPSTKLLAKSICSGLPPPRDTFDNHRSQLVIQTSLPVSISDPPSYAELFFSNVGDIPEQVTLNTSWEVVDDSVSICFNNSLISEGVTYSRFRLTAESIEGRNKIVATDFVIQLEVHDYVIISISLLFILCYVIWMIAHWKETTNTKLMMLSLLLTQFVALVFFAISSVSTSNSVLCRVVAACTQFLFLSTHTWTNALAIHITYTIYHVTILCESRKQFLGYLTYSIGFPLVLTLITLALHMNQETLNLQRTVYREEYICFLNDTVIIYSLFLGPLYIIIALNVSLCIASMVRVTRKIEIASNDKDRTTKNAITCIKLTICLGLGWIILSFQYVTNDSDIIDVIWIVVLIFIELQGILLVSANMLSWDCVKKLKKISHDIHVSGVKHSAASTELSSLQTNRNAAVIHDEHHI